MIVSAGYWLECGILATEMPETLNRANWFVLGATPQEDTQPDTVVASARLSLAALSEEMIRLRGWGARGPVSLFMSGKIPPRHHERSL